MNLQQLATFCTVISEGSMTGAAEKLNLTQPAVSQQIRSLEDELQVSLLVRGVRKVKPSMQGQLLYDYAKKILHLTQQAEVAIHTMANELSGEIKIGTTSAFGLHLVSPVVGLFFKHNSNLNLKLIYGSAEQIIADMKKSAIDMAILPDLKNEYGIQFDRYEERFVMLDEMWFVGATKDASLPETISLKEYSSRPIVQDSAMYPGFRRMLEQKLSQLRVTAKPIFESDNVGTLKRVIETGVGWGYMPAHSIRKQVRTRRLTRVHVDELKYSVNVNLYTLNEPGIKPMSETFYRAIQQQLMN
ncbi:MAG: LysR family transcriptional regulator [Bdellovibrionales bacterium]|nr:LysR family transcriptional regulator [Bdellovibrionales bacterium]